MHDELSQDYDLITRRLELGRVVVVLGAGVNMCGRPEGVGFRPGEYLPNGGELADALADELERSADLRIPHGTDLTRVSQYVDAKLGPRELKKELHRVFDANYPPNAAHRLLVDLARRTREGEHGGLVLITTNYDDALERAFLAAQEPVDVLTYIAQGTERGLFRHVSGTDETVIARPNEYTGLHLDDRALVAKIHGTVDRQDLRRDSYVITEDHYIDYLTRADVDALFPRVLAERILDSHLLFLGYRLADWNVRAMLHRIWDEQRDESMRSWAIDSHPDIIDKAAWHLRGVTILEVRLEDFVAEVSRRLTPDGQAPG